MIEENDQQYEPQDIEEVITPDEDQEKSAESMELLEIAQGISQISASVKYPGVTDSHAHSIYLADYAQRLREIARGIK